jgi:membrane peptidoglycan carboxypeptidase
LLATGKFTEEQLDGSGLSIITTIDKDDQAAAVASAEGIPPGAPTGLRVALASVDPSNGNILAAYGGPDYVTRPQNAVTQDMAQAGSTFKPFALIAAQQQGVSLYSSFSGRSPQTISGWPVQNSGNEQFGSIDLITGLTYSVNTVFARLIMQVGADKVMKCAQDLGFEAEMEPDPAMALGGVKYGVSPLEMARAYTTMAKTGECVQPRCVTQINDSDGKLLYEAPETPEVTRIYPAQVGKKVRDILHQVVTRGTGRAAQLSGGQWAAGKTGTTQSYRDAWFVGWVEGMTTAVWMGYPEAQVAMENVHGRRVTGGSFPAQIWHDYMEAALKALAAPNQPHSQETTSGAYPDIPSLEEIGINPDGSPR